MRLPLATFACLTALAAALPARSQNAPDGHGGHGAQASPSPVVRAFQDASDRMHQNMSVQFTGDADRDFAQAMIPHHQGAIDMARIVLEHGDDPELRNLAQGVIDTQEREIRQLRDWLARNPEN